MSFVPVKTAVRLCFDPKSAYAAYNGKLASVKQNLCSVYHEDGNRIYEVRQKLEVLGALPEGMTDYDLELTDTCFEVLQTPFLDEDVQVALINSNLHRLDPDAKVVEVHSQEDEYNTITDVFLNAEYRGDDGSLFDPTDIHHTIIAIVETDINPEGCDGFSTGLDTIECPMHDFLYNRELPRGERKLRKLVMSYDPRGISALDVNGWSIDYIGVQRDNIDDFINRQARYTRMLELKAPEIILLNEKVRLEQARGKLRGTDMNELRKRQEELANKENNENK